MAKITSFPITTTDQWSNESIQGLCSPLCADIQEYGTYTSGSFYQDSSGNILSGLGAISAVTFAPSAAISGYWGTSGTMTGDFISGYYNPSGDLYPSGTFISGNDITTLLSYNVTGQYDFSPSTGYVVSEYGIRKAINDYIDNAVTGINIGSGEGVFSNVTGGDIKLRSIDTQYNNRFTITSGSNGTVDIYYDGRGGLNVQQVSSSFVQGGSQQLWSNILGLSGFDTGITGVVSGFSTTSIPICANMQNTSLTADEYLSGLALYDWNTDIAIGKIAARIPIDSAFVNSGEVIWVGLTGDYDRFGYFLTRTSGQITTSGEYIPLEYSQNMYEDQYEYFMTPNAIFAYTTGVTLQQDLSSNFDLRVFYDQVKYTGSNKMIIMGGRDYAADPLNGSGSTKVEKFDMDTYTSVFQGELSQGRGHFCALENGIYIWCFGGRYDYGSSNNLSNVERISFANFTGIGSSRTSLIAAKLTYRGGQNNTNMYILGGTPNGTNVADNVIQSMIISNDTTSMIDKADLSVIRTYHGGCFTDRYIYQCGGMDQGGGTEKNSVDRFDMDNDTNNAIDRLDLVQATKDTWGSETNNYGYIIGGRDSSSLDLNTISRMDFSSDTTNFSYRGTLNIARDAHTSITNKQQTEIIVFRGVISSTRLNNIEKIILSNDTVSQLISLSLKRDKDGSAAGATLGA